MKFRNGSVVGTRKSKKKKKPRAIGLPWIKCMEEIRGLCSDPKFIRHPNPLCSRIIYKTLSRKKILEYFTMTCPDHPYTITYPSHKSILIRHWTEYENPIDREDVCVFIRNFSDSQRLDLSGEDSIEVMEWKRKRGWSTID